MINLWFFIYLILLCLIKSSFEMSCKDDKNKNVDWFILYKLPKISTEPSGSDLSSGSAYAYLTSSKPGKWALSSHPITSRNSMLGKIWGELNKKEKTATYLFYNDDSPDGFPGSAVGHLKGILAFDDKSGYWLIHSIPRFGLLNKYEYPENALTNGQTAICINFKVSDLNEISKQLLYANPNIYLHHISSKVQKLLDADAASLFSKKPAFIRSAPFQRKSTLLSVGRHEFISFAKDNQLPEDLYSDIIAPGLQSSLYAETWQRGAGTSLAPACQTKYAVMNIASIKMTVTERGRSKSIHFKSTEDHSKWAISMRPNDNWVCIADMNRMASQEKRGGGALCFKSNAVWKAFRDIISETDQCPI